MGSVGRLFAIVFSPEDAVIKAEHVECGHGGNHGHNPTHYGAELEAGCQYLVFREETGERRNAGNSQTGNQECNVCDRHVFAQTAHRRHFIGVYGMDDTTGTEE